MGFDYVKDEATLLTDEAWERLITRLRKTCPSRWLPPVAVVTDPALSENAIRLDDTFLTNIKPDEVQP